MPEQEEGNLKRNLGISRRDLLRRGAIVGGTVIWATPVIQSIGGRAFAGHGRYSACCQCTKTGQTKGVGACAHDHITKDECATFCDETFGEGVEFYSTGTFECTPPGGEGGNACEEVAAG